MHKPILFRIALLTLVALATWISSANAWEQYSSGGTAYDETVPGTGRTGNCATCHGDFRVPDYTSLSDGAAWTGVYSGVTITSLHDIHRRVITSGCSVCHNAAGRSPVPLDSSDGYTVGGTQEYTISCLGCHGRAETGEGGNVTSAGLRQHHYVNGVTTCAGCHPGDSNPATFTTVGEEVLPPYYAVVDTRNKPSDSCNFDGNETFAGTTGLDNDGDDLYDRADTDCALPHINLNPAALNFGDVAAGGSSTLNSAIENLGTVDLTVSAIALCAGTSTEFSFLAVTLPLTIAAAGSQALEVTYTPTDVGSDTGCIEITSDDPNEGVVQLALSGQSVPDINLNPAALDFGKVGMGNSAALNTAIENLGFADLNVSAIALCAGTSAEFSWTLATPFTVAPGANQTLEVTYAPVDPGADTGCLEITSDDPDEATVQLTLSSEVGGLLPLFIPAIIRPGQP
jgi:hypothetical protein